MATIDMEQLDGVVGCFCTLLYPRRDVYKRQEACYAGVCELTDFCILTYET